MPKPTIIVYEHYTKQKCLVYLQYNLYMLLNVKLREQHWMWWSKK